MTITEENQTFLESYSATIDAVGEGFEYLAESISENAPPETERVFRDIVVAMEQIATANEQLQTVLEEDIENLQTDFRDVTALFSRWFEKQINEEKRVLIQTKVLPHYEAWRREMQKQIRPYIDN
ncbi:hypothetical protein [Salimicrobium flavidum]|uniref:DUF8042 domain-containing protein n=1 Tax=Salimicrobium flavidum TaxID=570947 RepID=A0A1N7J1A6_9BACI|nr:hypothetical protein [Salimicrobium flavidum]SIS43001.1 hypothetical protein SAMN05421687_103148 [Salimicrobium flavidum]